MADNIIIRVSCAWPTQLTLQNMLYRARDMNMGQWHVWALLGLTVTLEAGSRYAFAPDLGSWRLVARDVWLDKPLDELAHELWELIQAGGDVR